MRNSKSLEEQIRIEGERKEKEIYTWDTLIKPIVDGYGITGIEYKFIPVWDEHGNVINKNTDLADIIKMERLTMQLCNGRPFNTFQELLIKWQNGTQDDNFSYKTFFIEFITHLFEEKTLPHFLEFLYKEYREKITEYIMERDEKNSVFPCPAGTEWKDIKITLINDGVVMIKTPSGRKRCTYHDLDMADERTRDKRPVVLWSLLSFFAKNQGYISRQNDDYYRILPDTTKRLNKKLQMIFGIKESIFHGHYKTEKGYRTKIFFSDKTSTI